MGLVAEQASFLSDVAKLIQFYNEQGYQVTGGELERTKEMAELYAAQGKGIKDSRHCCRCAIDLHLYKDGKYLADTESHRIGGEYWKSLNPNNQWGGDFKRSDGNHYERKV